MRYHACEKLSYIDMIVYLLNKSGFAENRPLG